jgi:hypothetical protein
MTYTVTSFGKAFAHVRNCLLNKAHVINDNIDGFYAKTTQGSCLYGLSYIENASKWKKKKNYDAIPSKYDSAEKRYINYAYVLKNGVGRFDIFF